MGAQALLLQAWVPQITEHGLLRTTHLWFISCLPLYWALHGVLCRHLVLRIASLRAASLVLVLLALPPWLLYFFPLSNYSADGRPWYSRQWGSVDGDNDIGVIFLKHHPISYLHVFVFGMVLARWRDLLKLERRARPRLFVSACAGCCNVGATAGYAALLVVFLAPPLRPLAHKLSARLSVLMPLQGLVLLGLSPLPPPLRNGATPSAGAAARPFSALERIDPVEISFAMLARVGGGTLGATSYNQYVFHVSRATALPPAAALRGRV